MPVRKELIIVDLVVLVIAGARYTASGDGDAGFWFGTFRAVSCVRWEKERNLVCLSDQRKKENVLNGYLPIFESNDLSKSR